MTIRAMIMAAGRGERMRPLTDQTPKPLLQVHGKPLMQWPMEALARGGFTELVINTAWLGEQIESAFGSEWRSGGGQTLKIQYSSEGRDFGGALETAGGICRALPLLGEMFWLLAGDVYIPGFDFSAEAVKRFALSDALAHIWLVPNPEHNPRGDFGLGADGRALNGGEARHTYSTIGLYRAALFQPPWCDIAPGNPTGVKAALAPLLRAAMDQGRVTAQLYQGAWTDVGTPQRLAQINQTPI